MTMAKTNFKSQKDGSTQIEGHRVDNIHFGIILWHHETSSLVIKCGERFNIRVMSNFYISKHIDKITKHTHKRVRHFLEM